MLGSLKEKINLLQEGLVGSSKVDINTEHQDKRVLNAGADVLSHYQTGWQLIHSGAETAAKQADRCDRVLSQVHAEYEKQWRHVALLSSLVQSIPELNTGVERILAELVNLQNLFSDVELALLTLEETLDARDMQERQNKQRFELSLYECARIQELQGLESNLAKQRDARLATAAVKEEARNKERQIVFQQKFQEDLEQFQRTGFLEVPLVRGVEVPLESVNLSEDEDVLEAFLEDRTPKGRTTKKSSSLKEKNPKEMPVNNIELSRDESLYFTPSQTMENINNQ